MQYNAEDVSEIIEIEGNEAVCMTPVGKGRNMRMLRVGVPLSEFSAAQKLGHEIKIGVCFVINHDAPEGEKATVIDPQDIVNKPEYTEAELHTHKILQEVDKSIASWTPEKVDSYIQQKLKKLYDSPEPKLTEEQARRFQEADEKMQSITPDYLERLAKEAEEREAQQGKPGGDKKTLQR